MGLFGFGPELIEPAALALNVLVAAILGQSGHRAADLSNDWRFASVRPGIITVIVLEPRVSLAKATCAIDAVILRGPAAQVGYCLLARSDSDLGQARDRWRGTSR
jgi:hypothetical protein